MTRITDVTSETFETAIAGTGRLVLVDLWSPTCAPCRTLAPILDDLAEDFAGEVAICKVDIAAEPAINERLAARGVPTLALFRDGQEVDRILGLRTRSQLTAWLESHL